METKFLNKSGLEHVISDLKEYLDQKEYVVANVLNDINDQLIDQSQGIQYDTTSNWNARFGYIPKAGALIIYSDYKTIEKNGQTVSVPGIKIGSGNGYVQDLPFLDDALVYQLINHIDNNVRHVNPGEREFWNNKINVDDTAEVIGESLIFNRN